MIETRLVALDPTSHGFGFVVFEGSKNLIDWGHAHIRPCSTKKSLERAAELLAWYKPTVLALEDWKEPGSRRGVRTRKLLSYIASFGESSGAIVKRIPKGDIKSVFAPSRPLVKHEVAQSIAIVFPELALRLPPPRKIWMSEDERMGIFDAAALALTYFHLPETLETVEF